MPCPYSRGEFPPSPHKRGPPDLTRRGTVWSWMMWISVTADIYQVPITHQALLSEPDAHNFTESLQRFSGSDVIDISINIGKRSKLKAPSSDSALFGNPDISGLLYSRCRSGELKCDEAEHTIKDVSYYLRPQGSCPSFFLSLSFPFDPLSSCPEVYNRDADRVIMCSSFGHLVVGSLSMCLGRIFQGFRVWYIIALWMANGIFCECGRQWTTQGSQVTSIPCSGAIGPPMTPQ